MTTEQVTWQTSFRGVAICLQEPKSCLAPAAQAPGTGSPVLVEEKWLTANLHPEGPHHSAGLVTIPSFCPTVILHLVPNLCPLEVTYPLSLTHPFLPYGAHLSHTNKLGANLPQMPLSLFHLRTFLNEDLNLWMWLKRSAYQV